MTELARDNDDAVDEPNTRVYRYGLLPPTVASHEVHQQLQLAYR